MRWLQINKEEEREGRKQEIKFHRDKAHGCTDLVRETRPSPQNACLLQKDC